MGDADKNSEEVLLISEITIASRNIVQTEESKNAHGFTLLELLIAVAVLAALTSVAIPVYSNHNEKAMIARAVAEINALQDDITVFEAEMRRLPISLNEIGWESHLDPWKNPYQYLNFALVTGKANMRKDKFLVPINSDYDLYSMGKDGKSQIPLTAKASHDDIIRADDGGFIGLAFEY